MSATGRNTKAIRKDHNLTQLQFAESVGVTTTTVGTDNGVCFKLNLRKNIDGTWKMVLKI